MMQMEETRPKLPEEYAPAEERLKGLHVLVGELLKANQELRFKVSFLEQQAESTAPGLEPGPKSMNA